MAILGITYQSLYHERYKWLETCFYVVVGVFPAVAIIDMVSEERSKQNENQCILDRTLWYI